MRVLFVLAFLLSGCWLFPGSDCTPFAQRCHGNLVQTCNTDRRWFLTNDCAIVEPTSMNWTCCTRSDGTPACLPGYSEGCRRQASRPPLRLPMETVAKRRPVVVTEGWF